MKLLTLIALLGCLSTSMAWAQCAPGIPSAGNPGCIPPDQPNSPYYQGTDTQTHASQPSAVWSDRWAAIAFGHTSILGTSKNQPDQRAAENSALEDCRKQGGQECVISISYHNQCGAVAWGTSASTTARAPTAEEAASDAMKTCRSKTSDCQIYYQNCTYPVRVQ